nr:RNA-directed DNA polymerase, eukaryota [Tanacetum cinerariifolium]
MAKGLVLSVLLMSLVWKDWLLICVQFSTNNKAAGDKGYAKTFVNVVKDNSMEKELSSAIVRDDDCLNTKELNTSLLGRVKEFASFSNLKKSFKVVFRGKVYWVRAKEVPGWISEFLEESEEDVFSDEGISNKMNDGGEVPDIDEVPETDFEETDGLKAKSVNGDNANDKSNDVHVEHDGNSIGHASKIANSYSIGPGRFKKSVAPCNRGSILSLMEEVVRGNLAFEYVHSDSIGNSGGILYVWDPNSFCRCSSTISDFFVILRGVWLKTGSNLLIVVVYAPHYYRDKRILWDYLSHVSNQWNGDVVMMGDFNEVRHKSDRFRSVFNAHGADIFNSFINNAGLEEIQLGGSMYTWCHKSTTKMSKMDRFFVSENLLNTCPNINYITLERYLSDHRPILLRESSCDYGPIPFWFFHYWIEVNEFDKLVMNSWYDAPSHDYRRSSNGVANKLKEELLEIDAEIDNGNGYADIVARRVLGDIVNDVQSAFIANRQILDGPFIVNEAIQWCKKKKKHALIFKVDFEKAYDSVRWDYLDDVWEKGQWHMGCLREVGEWIWYGSSVEKMGRR